MKFEEILQHIVTCRVALLRGTVDGVEATDYRNKADRLEGVLHAHAMKKNSKIDVQAMIDAAVDEEMAHEGENEEAPEEEDEVDAASEDEGDEGAEEDGEEPDSGDDEEDGDDEPVDEPEEDEPRNPLAMAPKLRREMGDLLADAMDEQGARVFADVTALLKKLDEDYLTLTGEFREALLAEVGARGIARLEPTFPEWRRGVMISIHKAIKAAVDQTPTEQESPSEVAATEVAEEKKKAPALAAHTGMVTAVVRPRNDFVPAGRRGTKLE